MDYNLTDRRGREEPTGEVLPLSDRVLKGMKMGDKYMRTKAPIQEQKKKRYVFFFYRQHFLGFSILITLQKEED